MKKLIVNRNDLGLPSGWDANKPVSVVLTYSADTNVFSKKKDWEFPAATLYQTLTFPISNRSESMLVAIRAEQGDRFVIRHYMLRGERDGTYTLSDLSTAEIPTSSGGSSGPAPTLESLGAVSTSDPRLSDARTPKAHTHSEYAPTNHTHDEYLDTTEGNNLYAARSHTHSASEISDLSSQLTGFLTEVTAADLPANTVMVQVAPATGRPTDRNDVAVLWLGYDDKPAQFNEDLDIYFTVADSTPPGDTTAPTTPAINPATNIGPDRFTLTFAASTDNVGVDHYEYKVGNGSWFAVTSGTVISGLSPSTSYTISLSALDAAGNRSVPSSINVTTTAAASGVEHNVLGSNAIAGATSNTDGTPSIVTATGFYLGPGATGTWECVGGRLYIPAGSTAIGKTLTISAVMGNATESIPDLGATAVRTGTTTAVAGWNEVRWSSPFSMSKGLPAIYIRSTTGDGNYITATLANNNDVPSTTDANLLLGYSNLRRAAFRIGTGSSGTPAQGTTFYCQDIIARRTA